MAECSRGAAARAVRFVGRLLLFAKVIVQEVPPLTVVLTRFAIAALALWLYLRTPRLSVPTSLSTWAAFAGMGLLNNLIPAALVTWSQKTIASGLAAILITTTPLFSILAAHWLTSDEKMTANKIAGILLGIAGVAILVGEGSLSGSEHAVVPLLACLTAAISYGLANVFGRRFKRMGIAPVVGANRRPSKCNGGIDEIALGGFAAFLQAVPFT